jgi:hypothetical protein
MTRRQHSGRERPQGRGLWALCAAYLLFSLSPHFETVRHAHAGGDEAHHHAAVSLHDAAVERAILIAAGTGPSAEGPRTHVAVANKPARRAALPRGTHGLQPGEGTFHAHGLKDPNFLSLSCAPGEFRFGFARIPRPEAPRLFPAETVPLPAQARAPPVS